MELIQPVQDWNSVAKADIVVEAVFEDMALKKEVFTKLNDAADPEAILATNTSMLDIGAVGAVALENLVTSDPEDFWKGLVLGGIAEGLMVAASRQYVKGWEVETALVHSQAAWYLTEALWRASSEMQPDLQPEQRWEAIQTLLAPAHDPDVPAPAKAVLLGRIFQVLLITYLARLVPALDTGEAAPDQEMWAQTRLYEALLDLFRRSAWVGHCDKNQLELEGGKHGTLDRESAAQAHHQNDEHQQVCRHRVAGKPGNYAGGILLVHWDTTAVTVSLPTGSSAVSVALASSCLA